jgi:rhamnose transport system substrate-binding protein
MSGKRLRLLIVAVAVVALAAGLTAGLGSAGSTKTTAGYKIFLLPKQIGQPVFNTNNLGAQEAAKALGDKVTYNGPTEATGSKQVPFIDTAVRQGYNAIIISADDPNAVAPALKRAQAKGVKVISYDSDTAPSARTIFVSGPDQKAVGFAQVEWLGSQIGYKGDFAILSATATATNQNAWIGYMKQALKLPKYKNMKPVKIAYGNDNDAKSLQEAQGLLRAYPNLRGIIAPTTVGVAAAARVVSQAKKCSAVRVTGLGLPSQMKSYVKAGCVLKFGLWNEKDFGYVAVQTAHALLTGKLTGKPGQSFIAGRLGKRTVGKGGVMIGVPPFAWTKATVDSAGF